MPTAKADGNVTRRRGPAPRWPWPSIDVLGLDKQDRKYLETIIRVFGGGPAGVEAIAHTMNLAPDTLADEVEPYLLAQRTGRPHAPRPRRHGQGV